ncbi:MAG: tRNA guanosine(34) transglycosylase Tgt [Actinomycetota bacterium]|nr:tRNA guanosine(34) transglycosylase Tgt [Actinomycetota bacterium]
MKLTLHVEATDEGARAGRVTSGRGVFDTPCFMPVGTQGVVKTLTSVELAELGATVVLANTYHLMLRPGADLVGQLGGLHRFTGWDGHFLTDSGGFQVFSLDPDVDDEGATFRAAHDGTLHHLSPERAVALQTSLGADIQMALDICPPLPSPDNVLRSAVDRTTRWAERARAAFLAPASEEGRLSQGLDQAQFGIGQGGADPALRKASASQIAALDFDGYGIGGLSVGESRDEMLPALAAALQQLPADQPRYLMGVGDPARLVESVALGVDMFDCVLPTRLGRHGTVLSGEGRYHLRNVRFRVDEGPLDADCRCPTCAHWSRAYLRHLIRVGEPTGARLITVHNLWWTIDLVRRMRRAICAGTFGSFRAEVLAVWG